LFLLSFSSSRIVVHDWQLTEEKVFTLEEKLELAEQRAKEVAALEEQLKRQAAAAAASSAAATNGDASDDRSSSASASFAPNDQRLSQLQHELEDKTNEVIRFEQRLRMNEDHNQRLSATVDKLLAESNDRLQVGLWFL
jgi:hypothetical protein